MSPGRDANIFSVSCISYDGRIHHRIRILRGMHIRDMDIVNLLEETKEALERNGRTFDDVLWIGCRDFRIPVERFMELADDIYDSSYGGVEVASDLIVVGDG